MKANLKNRLLSIGLIVIFTSCTNEEVNKDENTEIVTEYNYRGDELELIDKINQYRIETGRTSLELVNHISFKASEHNEYMIANNVVNHDHFEERADNIIRLLQGQTVGENVAFNFSSTQAVFQAWINSPGHRANIEGNYTHLGLSIRNNPTNNKNYFTVIFMKI